MDAETQRSLRRTRGWVRSACESRQAGRAGAFLIVLALVGCDPPPLTPNGVVGVFGGIGLGHGEFNYPRGIDVAPDGCVFVVDKSARIQRFSGEGAFETAWTMPERFKGKPVGLTVHPDGRLFVPDTHYHRVMVFDRDGRELARFGTHGRGDGEFELPTDVAIADDGTIYVSEYYGNDRITRWSPEFEFRGVLAAGEVGGKPLARPESIAIDAEQTIWCADACNHRLLRLDRDGNLLTQFGHFGDGPGELRYPYSVTVTPEETLLVCEYEGSRLQWFTKEGRSIRTWGSNGREVGHLWLPWGAAVAADGRVYVVDSYNSRVQIVRP